MQRKMELAEAMRVAFKDDKERLTITCPRCEWIWAPSPKLWKNHYNFVTERVLKCPRCSHPVTVPYEVIEKIYEYNMDE